MNFREWVFVLLLYFLSTGERCIIDLLEESERTGLNINAVKTDGGNGDQPKLSSAGAAIKTSSFVYDRWYKMVLK